MRRLILILLFLSSSFAAAQTLQSTDSFDTTVTANINGRRKWLGAGGTGLYIQTNGDSTIMAFSATAGTYAAAAWDSLITGPSMFQMRVASLGSITSGPAFYFYSYVPGFVFTNWTGYRIQWIHDGPPDHLQIERVTGGTTRVILGTISRSLAVNDTIRMYEHGANWRSVTLVRAGVTLDSLAVRDTIYNYNVTNGRWGIRGWWYSTGVQRMDDMAIYGLPLPPTRDTVPPVIVTLQEQPTNPDSTKTILINLRATDVYGLDSLYIRFGTAETGTMGDSLVLKCGTTKDTTLTLTLTPKRTGLYIYQARVRDDTGNVTTSSTLQFQVFPKILTIHRLYDDFDTLATPTVSGVRKKYVNLTNQSGSSATMQINADSTISPRNLSAGVFPGAVAIDSLLSGRVVVGFILKQKGDLQDNSAYIYLRMSGKDFATSTGYRLKILNQPVGTGTGIDILEIDNVTPPNNSLLVSKQIEFANGDTIYFKTYTGTNALVGLVRGTRSGVPFADSITAIGNSYTPASWYAWIRAFVEPTTTKIDNLYLDTLAGPPPPPVTTRDTIPPVFLSKGLSASLIDTSLKFNVSARIIDDTVSYFYSHIPSHGLDSIWMGIYTVPTNTLYEQKGWKISNVYATSFDTTVYSDSVKRPSGIYKVRFWTRDDSGNVATDSMQFNVALGGARWLTTYYNTWQMQTGGPYYSLQPWKINWAGITHVIEGGNPNIQATYPFLTLFAGGVAGDSLEWAYGSQRNPAIAMRDSLIKYAHLQGTKVLQQIVAIGSGGTALNTITLDSATTESMCRRIAQFVQLHGFDGVDINWETSLGTKTQTSLLFRRMRANLDAITTGSGGRATIHISPLSGGWGSYDAAVANVTLDQIDPQLYDMSAAWGGSYNVNWFLNPLHKGTTYAVFNGEAYDTRGPLQWVANGFKKNIMGSLMAVMGRNFVGSDVLFGGPYAGWGQDMVHFQNVSILKGQGYAETYDTARHAHTIHGTATANYSNRNMTLTAGDKFWFTFQDPRDIPDQVQWIKDNGFGGIGLYDMTADMVNTAPYGQTNPIINAFINALGNSLIIQAPATPVPNTIAGDPNNQPKTNIQLSWSEPSGATGYHFTLSTDSLFLAPNIIDEQNYPTASIFVGSNPYPSLGYSTRYYWRVAAVNIAGSSGFSSVQTFKIQADPNVAIFVPPIPVLVTPANNATNQQTTLILTVSKAGAGDTVTSFNIKMASDTNFVSVILDDSLISLPVGQTSASRTVTSLSQGTAYYWKARARNVVGYSAFTAFRKFTTAVAAQIVAFKIGNELVFDPTQPGFALRTPVRRSLTDVDPSLWTLPDSNEVGWYGRGFILRDGRKFDLTSAVSGMNYQQIIAELNKTNPTWTNYNVFAGGLSISYAGNTLATFDGNGATLTNLSVNAPARFNGLTTLAGGVVLDSIIASIPSVGIILRSNQLYFSDGGNKALSMINAVTTPGDTLTIIGQRGGFNQRGGNLVLWGGSGFNSGQGGDLILRGGKDGGLNSGWGKTIIQGTFQFINGNQGAGKYLTSDASGNIDFTSTSGSLADSTRKVPSLKDFYRFAEDWNVTGTGGFSVAGTNSNTFDNRWVAVLGGAAHSGNIITVDIDTVGVVDSSECSIVKFTMGGVDSTMGTGVVATLIPSGRGSTTKNSLYLRKMGLTMNVKFSMPATTAGMDSDGVIWGFTGSTTDGEDYSNTNSAGVYLQYANKLAGGSQDSIYAVVASGSAKTKKGTIKPTTSQTITSSIWISATGFNFKVNSTIITIPWSDANVPSTTQRATPILSTIQYGQATSGKVFRHYYYEYYFPTSR